MNGTGRTAALVLALAGVTACAPPQPDGPSAEQRAEIDGEPSLSPASWPAEDLEHALELFATQEAAPDLVEARNGMVVNAVIAPGAMAGRAALQAGGSAVDAVLTTAMTNIVLSLGTGMSYAGIASLVYFDAATDEIHTMDAGWNAVAEETEPASIPVGEPSGRTALVPGFMAGAEAAHARFGRLPWAALFEPALYFAEEGFEIPAFLGRIIQDSRDVLGRREESRRIYTRDDGEWVGPGDRLRQPALAATLTRVAAEGAAYMYAGEWARRLVDAVQSEGGHLTLDDLATYRPLWAEPAHASYGPYDVYAPGMPGGGGVNAIEALHLLELESVRELGHYASAAAALHRFMRIAHVQHVMNFTPPELRRAHLPELESAAAVRGSRAHARLIREAMESGAWDLLLEADDAATRAAAPQHTDAIVAVDADGNVAALTYSSNTILWGRTGIIVGGVTVPDAGAGNRSAAERAGPGGRLPSQLNPLIVLRDGEPVLASAAIGAAIHEATLQNLVNVLDAGMDPARAQATPRFLLYAYPGTQRIVGDVPLHTRMVPADAFPAALLDSVRAMGQPVVEVDPGKAKALSGDWIGIRRHAETGELQGVAAPGAGGLATGY